MSDIDAIIVGAGHNGLTCAAYLGMAGLRVRVFERRDVVGGACVTEEFHPGFRNSTAAYTVSLLQPKVIRDLKLYENGLRVVERRVQNFLPLPDGRYLLTGEGRTEHEIAKFSAKDAARYQTQIRRLVEVLRRLSLIAPPNLFTGDFANVALSVVPKRSSTFSSHVHCKNSNGLFTNDCVALRLDYLCRLRRWGERRKTVAFAVSPTPSRVCIRPRQVCNKAEPDRIFADSEYDWDLLGCSFGGEGSWRARPRENDVHATSDKISSKFR
jgi:NAD(P)-binding Rossmann-like domain